MGVVAGVAVARCLADAAAAAAAEDDWGESRVGSAEEGLSK